MIKRVVADGLNDRFTFDLDFHSDINIITGTNGSGKTTLLKLLWYAISGNIERIPRELAFRFFRIDLDNCWIEMGCETKKKGKVYALSFSVADGPPFTITREADDALRRNDPFRDANRAIAAHSGASIFFPTFRRIEGGFSIPSSIDFRFTPARYTTPEYLYARDSHIQTAMHELSTRLSTHRHQFVASIATDDIVRLLTTNYAELSERTNRVHTELSKWIVSTIRQEGGLYATNAAQTLEEISRKADAVTRETEALLRPFTVLGGLIYKIFQYRGIAVTDFLTLGETNQAISSHMLSAGEKQMLSFLAYNAFSPNTSIFIDEPEISLHVDWQRTLFPTLMSQTTNNQFIVATHSPFIYAKYADKELVLNIDKGAADADSPAH